MSGHPSITFEVTFPSNTKDEVLKAIEKTIISTPHFDLDTDSTSADITANFLTPTCKWLDVVTFKCTDTKDSQSTFTVRSGSTSACCCANLSCCLSWRNAFSGITKYSDHKKNEEHINVLLKKSGLKYEMKQTERIGF
jgi:hypothetical protein